MNVSDPLLNEHDVEALQELLESQPEYAEQVTGYPPGPSDALSALLPARSECSIVLPERCVVDD